MSKAATSITIVHATGGKNGSVNPLLTSQAVMLTMVATHIHPKYILNGMSSHILDDRGCQAMAK